MMQVMAWLEIHQARLIAALVLLILAVGAVLVWRNIQADRQVRANADLLQLRARPGAPETAPTAADYLRVVEQYPSTLAGRRARLLAAGAFYEAGQYTEALAEFERAHERERSGSLAAQAAYGVAASLDALDRVEDAVARYQAVLAAFPADSVAGQARLALARIHEVQGQPESALRLYDELLRDREAGAFAQQAMQQRDILVRRHPHLAGTNAPAVPMAPLF